jgi:excisionase family DNA binding protein
VFTVRQVAERLSVSQATIYALVASGRLAACRIGLGRGCIRFTEEQIENYLRATGPTPRAPATLKHIRLR